MSAAARPWPARAAVSAPALAASALPAEGSVNTARAWREVHRWWSSGLLGCGGCAQTGFAPRRIAPARLPGSGAGKDASPNLVPGDRELRCRAAPHRQGRGPQAGLQVDLGGPVRVAM